MSPFANVANMWGGMKMVFGRMGDREVMIIVLGWLCAALPAWSGTTVTQPYAGITRHSVDNASVNGRSVDYEVIVINTLDAGISFFLTPDNGGLPYETTRQTTKNFASAYSTEVAINAHFFDTGLSPETDNTGIAASNGTVYSPFESVGGLNALNITADNFPETVTGTYNATTFASTPELPYNAINPGSMLIRNGSVLNTGATDFRPRSQIGVSRNGAEMMLFASSSGMTEQEGATILVNQFGAFNVHGLDGGGSTTLVLRTGTTTQTIIARESAFSERAVGTNLGVQAAPFVAGIPEVMSWDAAPGTAGIQQGSGVWDVSTTNWQASGTNRTWANPKTPILGAGGGAVITLAQRVGVRDMTVDGGYTIGTVGGPTFTILGNFTTTGVQPTAIQAPLGTSSTFTKLGNQTLFLGSSARISRLTMEQGAIDLTGQTLTIIDPIVPLTLKGGTIQNGAIVLTESAPDFAVPSGITTISANLTTPKMTKSGTGTVILTGSNSWGTPLTVNAGTLGFGPTAVIPNTAVAIPAGSLELGGANATISTLTLGGTAGESSTVTTASGTLTLGGTLTYSATNNPLGAVVAGQVNLGGTRIFTVGDSTAASDDLTVSADLSGAFNLTKNGAGTLVLSGNNSFNAFTHSAGTTRAGADEALGTTTLTVSAGLVDLNGCEETVTALTLGGVASALPELRMGAGRLNLNGGLTYSATSNGLGGLIRGDIDLGASTRTFTIGNSTNAATDLLIEAAITGTGTGGLTKAGAGRLELAGPLNIPGTFTVNNGEVLISGGNRTLGAVTLGGTANVTALLDTGNTTLSLNGTLAHSSSNNGLGATILGRVDLGAVQRTFTINNSTNAAVDLRIEAELAGSGGFSKGGAGTLELAGANTLTGPIAATAGGLALSHSAALGSAPSLTFSGTASLDVTGMPGGTLVIDRANLVVSGIGNLSGHVSMSSGRLVVPGSGALNVSGNLNFSGGTTELKVGTGAGTLAASGSAHLGGTLRVNMGGTALSGTQSIPILTAASITGNFSAFELPPAPSGTVYSVSVTSTQVIFQVAPGSPSQTWLTANSIPTSTPMGQDTDGDGFPLLLEYALGGSASAFDGHLAEGEFSGGFLHIGFYRNPQATDVTLIVEGSPNLSTWTTLLTKTGAGSWTGTAAFSEGTPVNGLVPVTVTDTGTVAPRFLRVRVVQP